MTQHVSHATFLIRGGGWITPKYWVGIATRGGHQVGCRRSSIVALRFARRVP